MTDPHVAAERAQLAERLFSADRDVLVAEDELMDLVQTTEVADKWDDWGRDYYDSSLELYGVHPDARLSPESCKKFEAAGLSIVWLNHSDNWETMYSLHRGGESRRQTDARVNYGNGFRQRIEEAKRAAFEAGRSSGEQIVVTQIEQSTGPTGGWLDSPKAICAAIVQALKGKP